MLVDHSELDWNVPTTITSIAVKSHMHGKKQDGLYYHLGNPD